MRRVLISFAVAAFLVVWGFLLANLFNRQSDSLADPFRLTSREQVFHEELQVEAHAAVDRALLEKLNQPAQFEFIDAELTDVATYIETTHDLKVVLDRRSLWREDIDARHLISISLPKIRLSSALTLLLEPNDLTWTLDGETIRITSIYSFGEANVPRIFKARDLLLNPHDPEQLDRETLPSAITTLIAPDSWKESSGAGSISELKGTLVVHQREEVLREIGHMLAALRQAKNDFELRPTVAVRRVYRWDDTLSADADERIKEAMNRPLPKMQFSEAPLGSIIRWLSQQTDAPLYLAPPARNSAVPDVASKTESITFDGQLLGEVLPELLARHDLEYQIRHDVLYIDSDLPDERDLVRIYLVADFIDPNSADEELFWRYYNQTPPIIDLIDQQLQAVGENVDPYNDVAYLDSIDVILVRAPKKAHESLQSFFDQYRAARGAFDYSAHSRALHAARQRPIRLPYQTASNPTSEATAAELRVMLPGSLTDRVEFYFDDDKILWCKATPADHRHLEETIREFGLPVWRMEESLNQNVFVTPIPAP